MTFPDLEMTILKFHDFCRFSMTVRTLQLAPRVAHAVSSYRHHGLPQLRVLADDGRVDVLAEDGPVVVDVGQVDVHGGHVAERRRAAVRGLDGDVVLVGDLEVQRLDHKDVT